MLKKEQLPRICAITWILQHIGGQVPQNLQLCLIQAVQTQGAALKELWNAGTVQGVMQPVDKYTN